MSCSSLGAFAIACSMLLSLLTVRLQPAPPHPSELTRPAGHATQRKTFWSALAWVQDPAARGDRALLLSSTYSGEPVRAGLLCCLLWLPAPAAGAVQGVRCCQASRNHAVQLQPLHELCIRLSACSLPVRWSPCAGNSHAAGRADGSPSAVDGHSHLDKVYALQVMCWHGRCPCRLVSLCQPRCACIPGMPAASSHFMQLCSSSRASKRLPGHTSSQHRLRQPRPGCHRVLGTALVCLRH